MADFEELGGQLDRIFSGGMITVERIEEAFARIKEYAQGDKAKIREAADVLKDMIFYGLSEELGGSTRERIAEQCSAWYEQRDIALGEPTLLEMVKQKTGNN